MQFAVDGAEAAMALLSNAIQDALAEATGDKSNLYWADAAVDRAMADLAKIRQWLEG